VSVAGAIEGSQLPGLTLNTGTISGRVFLDYNGNGESDQGEPALAGQTIFLDLNNSGRLDPGDPTATTDQNGLYQFTGLAAGAYTVRQLLPAGFTTLGTSGTIRVGISQAQSSITVNFADLAMQPNPTTAFVAALYGDLLDRAPDAAGLANWVARLNQGLS